MQLLLLLSLLAALAWIVEWVVGQVFVVVEVELFPLPLRVVGAYELAFAL